MAERTANLADGTVLHFPEGTPDSVIQDTVKQRAQLSQSPSQIAQPPDGSLIQKGAKVVANVDPFTVASVVSGVAGAAAGMGSAGVPGLDAFSSIIGSGTMAATDKLLRGFIGEYKPENSTQVLTDTAKDALLNEVVGKAADFVLSKGNAAYEAIKDKASTVTDFSKFKPTFSQLLRNEGSPYSRVTGMFEDLFAPTDKSKALAASFEAAKDEGDKFLENLSGRKGISLENSDLLTDQMKQGAAQQFLDLKNESNSRGEAAKLIASANAQIIPIMEEKTITSPILDASGKTTSTTQMVKTGEKKILGPVDYTNTIQAANKLLNDMKSASVKPDPESPVFIALNDILSAANAIFDKKGNLVSSSPIDFAQAWKDKQITSAIGYGGNLTDQTIKDTRFKQIANAIDTDIENSIPKWKNNGDKALQLYTEAKQIVAKRNDLFNPADEVGKSIDDLINKSSNTKANVYAILDDPTKLQRYLNTGTITIPDGSGTNFSKIKFISSNARADAQGATIQRFLNSATTADSLDNTKSMFDATKLMSLINDPDKQESLRTIFGSQGLSNVKQLFKNIAMTTQKGTNIGASRYLGLKIGTYGITLGSGIATALTEGVTSTSGILGGIGATVTLGAHELAKVMTNPESARVLLAMSQGTPLNMSTQMATRVLANALRNKPVTITYSDGNSVDGKINNLGKFTIPIEMDLSKMRVK